MYSQKAKIFGKKYPSLKLTLLLVKTIVIFFHNFVAYSEYMNFIPAFAIEYSFVAGRPILPLHICYK